jgi:hypothetical protein
MWWRKEIYLPNFLQSSVSNCQNSPFGELTYSYFQTVSFSPLSASCAAKYHSVWWDISFKSGNEKENHHGYIANQERGRKQLREIKSAMSISHTVLIHTFISIYDLQVCHIFGDEPHRPVKWYKSTVVFITWFFIIILAGKIQWHFKSRGINIP